MLPISLKTNYAKGQKDFKMSSRGIQFNSIKYLTDSQKSPAELKNCP